MKDPIARRFAPGSLVLFLFLALVQAQVADPLAGRWALQSQEIDGQKVETDQLILRIVQRGTTFDFGYSVPVNNIQFVSMSFSSHLDGSEADVKDAKENKIGTIKVSRAGTSQYNVLLQGTNRPSVTSVMKVSADGKTLTCQSDSKGADQKNRHTVQIFSRQ